MAAVRDNWMRVIPGGDYDLYFGDDKTTDTHGPTRVRIARTDPVLTVRNLHSTLTTYLQSHREWLCLPGQDDEHCLFINSRGMPFMDSEFSAWIQTSFLARCGRRVSFNLLRSAFVTAMMEDTAAAGNASTRQGVAVCMRSSLTYQQQSYDRRTASQISAVGRAFAERLRAEHASGAAHVGGAAGVDEADDDNNDDDDDDDDDHDHDAAVVAAAAAAVAAADAADNDDDDGGT